jgi:hypothetical protein
MKETELIGLEDERDETTEIEHYLPATPSLSGEPGPIEKFVTTLFRRRGERPIIVRKR